MKNANQVSGVLPPSSELVPEFARSETGKSETLVVMLHAYNSTRQDLKHVSDAVKDLMPDADRLAPDMRVSFFSFKSPTHIVCNLVDRIQECWDKRIARDDKSSYRSITIVGHSLGAVLARKLLIYASGAPVGDCTPFEPEAMDRGMDRRREWVSEIDRLVLLAGMNRGWELNPHASWSVKREQYGGVCLGYLLLFLRFLIGMKSQPLAFHVRRGAPFMINLRLQWLEMRSRSQNSAFVVQLLGSKDDVVSPSDDIDLICGSDFAYLDMPHSGHYNVVHLDQTLKGRARFEVFRRALLASRKCLANESVTPNDAAIPVPDRNIELVVFVIHGIRDKGYWTNKVARRVVRRGKEKRRQYATKTASYGYFPLLDFIIPWRRRVKAIWLMDQYVESRARYPNANFHYVGHSNGTLLLGHALRKYLGCRFGRVVFAGSPLNRKFFQKPIQGRIGKLLNYRATKDLVVATFPKGLQWLSTDLGSAGHDGFDVPSGTITLVEDRYVIGGHSAAILEDNWNAIALFIDEDNDHAISENLLSRHRNPVVVFLGILSAFFVVPMIVLMGAVEVYLVLYSDFSLLWREFWFLVCLFGIIIVLRRF